MTNEFDPINLGLEELLKADQSPKGVLPHLNDVANSANNNTNRTRRPDGSRISPINFRLTDQPNRESRLQELLKGFQGKTKKPVTLGLFMSALVDNRHEILNNPELVEKIVESMRDM